MSLPLLEQIGHVFTGVFSSGIKEGYLSILCRRQDAGGKDALSFRRILIIVVFHQLQDLHRRIVVVDDIALGRLEVQFRVDGIYPVGELFDDLPLGRCCQGNSKAGLELFNSVKRHPAAVL